MLRHFGRFRYPRPFGRGHRRTRWVTPPDLLRLGICGGSYMPDCRDEFPASWFRRAKLCSDRYDAWLNFFGVNASKPLANWRAKGWIYHEDPRG